jgi:mannose-6-phosphate isomerase
MADYMSATRLSHHIVPKMWGRCDLPDVFCAAEPRSGPIGEIWFKDPIGDAAELLIKYLFTSDRLSVQTHPDDAAARRDGLERGKDEAWVVLTAEPSAVIGLGLKMSVAPDQLRQAALDGSIVDLVDWRPVQAGDTIYSPAGTIHAIGGGISLIEVQQNCDVTYRLYDYGRDRELHLEKGVAAARPDIFRDPGSPERLSPGRTVLCQGRKFILERWEDLGRRTVAVPEDRTVWLIPLASGGSLDGERVDLGQVWRACGSVEVELRDGAAWLAAYAGATPIAGLFA